MSTMPKFEDVVDIHPSTHKDRRIVMYQKGAEVQIMKTNAEGEPEVEFGMLLQLQTGTIPEAGNNGFTIENLIEIAKLRIEKYNRGEYVCEENNQALDFLTLALEALERRTKNRTDRGVEGTMKA